jgi:hypothetical protein
MNYVLSLKESHFKKLMAVQAVLKKCLDNDSQLFPGWAQVLEYVYKVGRNDYDDEYNL